MDGITEGQKPSIGEVLKQKGTSLSEALKTKERDVLVGKEAERIELFKELDSESKNLQNEGSLSKENQKEISESYETIKKSHGAFREGIKTTTKLYDEAKKSSGEVLANMGIKDKKDFIAQFGDTKEIAEAENLKGGSKIKVKESIAKLRDKKEELGENKKTNKEGVEKILNKKEAEALKKINENESKKVDLVVEQVGDWTKIDDVAKKEMDSLEEFVRGSIENSFVYDSREQKNLTEPVVDKTYGLIKDKFGEEVIPKVFDKMVKNKVESDFSQRITEIDRTNEKVSEYLQDKEYELFGFGLRKDDQPMFERNYEENVKMGQKDGTKETKIKDKRALSVLLELDNWLRRFGWVQKSRVPDQLQKIKDRELQEIVHKKERVVDDLVKNIPGVLENSGMKNKLVEIDQKMEEKKVRVVTATEEKRKIKVERDGWFRAVQTQKNQHDDLKLEKGNDGGFIVRGTEPLEGKMEEDYTENTNPFLILSLKKEREYLSKTEDRLAAEKKLDDLDKLKPISLFDRRYLVDGEKVSKEELQDRKDQLKKKTNWSNNNPEPLRAEVLNLQKKLESKQEYFKKVGEKLNEIQKSAPEVLKEIWTEYNFYEDKTNTLRSSMMDELVSRYYNNKAKPYDQVINEFTALEKEKSLLAQKIKDKQENKK